MMVKRMNDMLLRLLCCMAVTATVTGCIKDDLSDCENTYYLMVRAYVESGAEIDASDVKDVSLFLFDGTNRFTQRIDTQLGERVRLDVPAGEDIHLIAWGNLKQGGQTYTNPAVGDLPQECFVSLTPTTRATSYALSPDDLLRGEITIAANDRSGDKILPIYREMGSMTVTVRNLKGFTGFSDNDFSIVVRETCSVIDFNGLKSGDKVSYLPAGTFASGTNPDYLVPTFNMVSEDAGLEIDICHGTNVIATVSTDKTGAPITIEKGKLTNILIELTAEVNVSMSINDWGSVEGWKIF